MSRLVNLEDIKIIKNNNDHKFSFCSNNDSQSISALYNSFCKVKDITKENLVNTDKIKGYFGIELNKIDKDNLLKIVKEPSNSSTFKKEYDINATLYQNTDNIIKKQYKYIESIYNNPDVDKLIKKFDFPPAPKLLNDQDKNKCRAF